MQMQDENYWLHWVLIKETVQHTQTIYYRTRKHKDEDRVLIMYKQYKREFNIQYKWQQAITSFSA